MDFAWITNDVGDITAVTAGTGISGGGTSGAVTVTNSITNTNQLTNGAGYITGVTNISGTAASETLATVTARGATTSQVVTLSGTANNYSGHHYFIAYDASGNHYPHYQNGSSNVGAIVNTRVYTGSGGSWRLFVLNGQTAAISWDGNTIYHAGNIPTWNQSTTGNAATVTNGVYTTGDQTIGGIKTFSSKIIVGTFPNSTTNTGEAWFGRASDRNQGTYTIQLGGNSASNRQFEVVDYAWSTVLFSVGSNGNIVSSGTISASNYSGTHSGSSSGTNTGDQTNISGNADNATYISQPDWRNTDYTPSQYRGNSVVWAFDNLAGSGPRGRDYWSTLQTNSPWSVYNDSHRQSQLLWGGSGGLSYRYAVGSGYTVTGWSTWESIITSATISSQSVVTIQDAAPSGSAGRLWWESDTGKLKVYYGSAWVDASPIPDSSLFFAKAGGSITGDVSIGQTLNVVGNTLVQGTIYSFGDVIAYSSSDARLKDNITVIESPLEKVSKINGVSFNWNDKQTAYEVGKKDIGVIAQEVEEVLPELVTTRDNGYKAVRYEKIVALLIEAVKDQQAQINNLTDKLNNL
jgi:hypothetical protein